MWAAGPKGKGKGGAYGMPGAMPYGKGGAGAYGGAYGPVDAYGMPFGKADPFGMMKGGMKGGKDMKGKGKNAAGGPGGVIEGLHEAIEDAFRAAGVELEEPDVEEMKKKISTAAYKQAGKLAAHERANEKMTAVQAKAFVGECVETIMSAFQAPLYEKTWFDKVAWNGILLTILLNAFSNGKMFTRIMKPEIIFAVDEGLLAWSEEERIQKAMWNALELAGIGGKEAKKANGHLMKAYDEAHMSSSFGNGGDAGEVSAIQDFVKGWMSLFADKAYSTLTGGLTDTSDGGQAAALTMIFQTLLDPSNPCLPMPMQPSLPSAPWSFIESCATEVVLGGK